MESMLLRKGAAWMRQLFYRIIYHPDVNKVLRGLIRPFAPFTPWARLPPVGRFKVEVKGHRLVFETNQTSHVMRLLYWDGPSAFEYTDVFVGLAERVSSFVDVGANVGFYSLLAAKCNPEMQVFAFEPSPGPLHFLRLNAGLNGLDDRVRIFPLAASSSPGRFLFNEVRNRKYPFTEHHLNGDSGFIAHSGEQHGRSVEVVADTLDRVLSVASHVPIELVKIDTEGTENDVLQGFGRHIDRDLPIVICEMLFGRIEAELEAIMKPKGYLFFSHRPDGLYERASLVRRTDDGVRNVFFVHPSRLELVQSHIRRGT